MSIRDKIFKGTRKTIGSWVSGTQVSNYLLKDPVIDWLNLYYSKYGLNNKRNLRRRTQKAQQNRESTLMKNGLAFEAKIYEDMTTKFGADVVNLHGERDVDLTFREMDKGTPIIFQAFIQSKSLKLQGIADMIVRSDYINKITHTPVLNSDKVFYVVVDIKWSHMTLCVDGKTIRNEGRYKAYKGQLLIYNTILGEMQGYTPPCAYIMPKSWNIDKKGAEKEGYNCYDILGVINYEDRDSSYVDDTIKAINWVREVREKGSGWTPLDPHIPEMCCNASNTNDEPWGEVKKRIMDETHDITKVWMISPEHRNRAFIKKIKRWDDKRCTPEVLGISDGKRRKIIDEILKINQQDRDVISRDIKDNRFNWKRKYPTDFYIDYETINESFIEDKVNIHNSKLLSGYIFMIGVGYEIEGKFEFKNFSCRSYTPEEEWRIVLEFQNFIHEMKARLDPNNEYPVRFFHWAHVEKTLLESFFQRSNTTWRNYDEIR